MGKALLAFAAMARRRRREQVAYAGCSHRIAMIILPLFFTLAALLACTQGMPVRHLPPATIPVSIRRTTAPRTISRNGC